MKLVSAGVRVESSRTAAVPRSVHDDLVKRRIVGYSIDTRINASLAVAALRNAVALREPAATIVHSDRGSQFRSRKFVKALHHNGLQGSMGRVGACGDNAAIESFFALLQNNVLDRQRWRTRDELRLSIVTWIERTYHADAANAAWADSPRSSLRQSTGAQPRPEPFTPRVN